MYYNKITIPDEQGNVYYFSLSFNQYRTYKIIKVKGVCIIYIHKIHDHRYDLKCFFYKTETIYYQENIRSKKELYSAIQKTIENNL